MGYHMNMRDQSFFVEKENFDKLAEAVRGMLKDVGEKGGGACYSGGKTVSKHYYWVNNSELEDANTAEKAFQAWRWDPEFDIEGNICGLEFEGEKLGDDEQFFQTIAPWVRDGSFIEMEGEDGTIWRWTFDDGKMTERTADIHWK